MMQKLNFPAFRFTFKEDQGRTLILDPARRRYVALTPEEWVRQHVIRYLHEVLGYPISHMAVEKGLTVNQQTRRADILVYDKQTMPAMLVECKAPEVKLSNNTFAQVSAYNIKYKVPWLLITNGITHHAAYIDFQERGVRHLITIPGYDNLSHPPGSDAVE